MLIVGCFNGSPNILPPRIADFPFKKVKIPENLYSKIIEEYKTMNFQPKRDIIECGRYESKKTMGGISILNSTANPYYDFCKLSETLYDECYEQITPLIQEWANCELEKTWGYGVRSYLKNSILHLHRDKIETHIISCIIFIDEKSNVKWPLNFFDHDFNHHRIIFEPGEMLFYESLCPHARLIPFDGEYYRNTYFHWKPKNWNYKPLLHLRRDFDTIEDLYNYYGR